MKKFLLTMLTILICMVSAQAQSFEIDGISYNVTKAPNGESTGEVEVTGGVIKEVIEFPDSVIYNEVTYYVTSICSHAFSGRTNAGDYTRKYVIPGTVRSIGNDAFYDNYYLEEVEFNEGLLTIDACAFEYNFALKEIRIPSTVTAIAENVFHTNQQNLATIYCLAETPPSIQPNTFGGRTDAPLIVPKGTLDNYKSLGEWNFTFIFEEGSIYDRELTDEQGLIYTLVPADDGSYYYSVTGHSDNINSEIVIPEDLNGCFVKTILEYVFYYCSSLLSIRIPISVTSIGDGAFQGCSNLTNVTLGGQLTSIGRWVFSDCTNLSSIVIPNNITSIGERAFENCSSLSSITIPDSVTDLGSKAFSGCSGLTSVTIGSGITSLKGGTFEGCSSLSTIVIPNSITSIEDGDKRRNGISNATPVYGYEHHGVFSDCTSLASITIPNSVTYIGNCAFYGCTSLISVTIPNSVTSIGNSAFANCSGLTTIKISNRVTTIGEEAFWCCTSLSSIAIPNSVTTIGNRAFYNCSGLISVTLGSSITNIGIGTFQECGSLTNITIPNSVTSIEDGNSI